MPTNLRPEDVPFHRNVLGSNKGTWIIHVESVQPASDHQNLVVDLLVRRASYPQAVERRLRAEVMQRSFSTPGERERMAIEIRGWIESTDDDGFLDLTPG